MEIKKKFFSLAATPKAGELQVGDVCKHPNEAYTYIYSDKHLKFASENGYERVDIHVLGSTNFDNGDYVVERGNHLFGPVEEGDRTTLEGARKVVATTDKGLKLPIIPDNFLKRIYSLNPKHFKRVLVDTTIIYNNGSGWKHTLLPSEWNDNVEKMGILVTDDNNEVNITDPNLSFSIDDMEKAFSMLALDGQRPKDQEELNDLFNEFLIKLLEE